jgi:hypothetical protein
MENIFHIVFNIKHKSLVKVRSPFAFATLCGFDSIIVKNTSSNQKVSNRGDGSKNQIEKLHIRHAR